MPKLSVAESKVAAKLYKQGKTIAEIAQYLDINGNWYVHTALRRASIPMRGGKYPDGLEDFVRTSYEGTGGSLMNLDDLAAQIETKFGRRLTRASISRMARRLVLSNQRRVKFDAAKGRSHPRGMLGKKHSVKTKAILGKTSRGHWQAMTKKQRSVQAGKMIATRVANNTLIRNRTKTTWKAGWHTFNRKRYYFRSRWEVNYARYLERLRKAKEIQRWEYEPTTFIFEKILRGTRSYTPDFLVTLPDGTQQYREIKGWMDSRSRIQQVRMRRYYPKVPLMMIDSAAYKALQKQEASATPGWELA